MTVSLVVMSALQASKPVAIMVARHTGTALGFGCWIGVAYLGARTSIHLADKVCDRFSDTASEKARKVERLARDLDRSNKAMAAELSQLRGSAEYASWGVKPTPQPAAPAPKARAPRKQAATQAA